MQAGDRQRGESSVDRGRVGIDWTNVRLAVKIEAWLQRRLYIRGLRLQPLLLRRFPSSSTSSSTTNNPPTVPPAGGRVTNRISEALTPQQAGWFVEWWNLYWLHKARKNAEKAFRKKVNDEPTFADVMSATKAQRQEMLSREPDRRPHGATWLNGERWKDELITEATAKEQSPYPMWN